MGWLRSRELIPLKSLLHKLSPTYAFLKMILEHRQIAHSKRFNCTRNWWFFNSMKFKNMDLSCDSSSRIAIVGENGAGKSTLLKLLLQKLTPSKGFITVNRNMRVSYFAQHHIDGKFKKFLVGQFRSYSYNSLILYKLI